MKAKSDILVEDVSAIVEIGLQLFQISENKLYAQVHIWVYPAPDEVVYSLYALISSLTCLN